MIGSIGPKIWTAYATMNSAIEIETQTSYG